MRSAAVLLSVLLLLAFAWLYFAPPLESDKLSESSGDSSATTAPTPQVSADRSAALLATPAEETLEKEAIAYIQDITAAEMEPVAVEDADHFVRSDQTISLIPDESIEVKTLEQILSDNKLSDTTPITVIRETEQIVISTPARLIQQAGGNLRQKISILEDDQVRELSIGELREQYADVSEQAISVIQKAEHIEILTRNELKNEQTGDASQVFRVITQPYHLDSTTVGELLLVEGADSEDKVFYVRSVKSHDAQGIWGIVHSGLIENFARGIAIRRDQDVTRYQVEIPEQADEIQENQSSSFLGRLIHKKVSESFVYNFDQGRMGRNPDLIHPGQEIIIISFSNDELINIYKHFVRQEQH